MILATVSLALASFAFGMNVGYYWMRSDRAAALPAQTTDRKETEA